jgi:hypothetical protein
VQDAPTPIVAPVKLAKPEPAVAVAVPPQVLVNPFGVDTTIPTGNVSANATPASATVFATGLVTANVKDVVPFSGIAAAPNAFASEGGATTAIFAEAVPPGPPSVELTALVVLFCAPAKTPVTFILKLHELLDPSVAPAKLIKLVPCVPVIVPLPHIPLRPFGVEITNPAGRVSVNPTPDKLCVVLLFWSVKLSEVAPFNGMLAAPNALMITAGVVTVMLAFEVFPVPPSDEIT